MPKRFIVWLPALGIMSLLGACGSDSVGSSAATVQQGIDRCHDDLASCDRSSTDCEAGAMDCMAAVNGNGVNQDEIAEHCDALYDLCSTKTDDLTFCEGLHGACLDCIHRYDDDTDDDRDTDDDGHDDDGHDDGDDDGHDDDDDGHDDDDDGHDDDGHDDDDEDRCSRDDDDDSDEYDDDNDEYDEDDDDDSDCDHGGTGGMAGTGGSGGTAGTGGSGGTAGTGGSGGMAGSGGTAGTSGSGGMAGTGGAGGSVTGISFATDIQPYFEAGQANCVRCHSGGGGPAGVNLDTYAGILAADPSGALTQQLNANHLDGPDDAGFVLILSQWIDEGELNN